MEVAGLVFGVLPLAISAIKCYEHSSRFLKIIKKRNLRLMRLRKAPNDQKSALDTNIQWLLIEAGAYQRYQTTDEAKLLGTAAIQKDIRTFLGGEAEDSLRELLTMFTSLTLLNSIRYQKVEEVRIRYRDGFKLALSMDQLDDCIAKADKATNTLDRIRNRKGDIQLAKERVGKGQHLLRSHLKALLRVREHASRLYEANCSCWSKSCHSVHEVNLFLDDRLDPDPAKTKSKTLKHSPVNFRIVFTAMSMSEPGTRISRDSYVEVLKDKPEFVDEQAKGGVRFVLPQLDFDRAKAAANPINICQEVCDANELQHALHLYVHPKCTIHRQDREPIQVISTGIAEFATLRALLKQISDSRKRLLPLACAELALSVASTTIQLGSTPWLCSLLTKDGIYFARRGHNELSVDKPLMMSSFSNARNESTPTGRKIILELAILFLELWHGTTFEDRFHDRPNEVNGDDLNRQGLVMRWLAEDRTLLSFQSNPVSNCLGYLHRYDEIFWTDEDFLDKFAAGVIEPLLSQTRKRTLVQSF